MYELTCIINPNLSEQEVAAQTDKIRGFINEFGGQIKNERLGEKRRLAYPMKKHGYGFYVTVEFNAEPENIIELEKKLRLEAQILRHLLISKDEPGQAPRKFIPRPKPMPEMTAKPAVETPAEKIKIEEIDKRLEEILEE
jgi:small subunit ribosomal protein S6